MKALVYISSSRTIFLRLMREVCSENTATIVWCPVVLSSLWVTSSLPRIVSTHMTYLPLVSTTNKSRTFPVSTFEKWPAIGHLGTLPRPGQVKHCLE